MLMARPRPRLPPVTTATFPLRSNEVKEVDEVNEVSPEPVISTPPSRRPDAPIRPARPPFRRGGGPRRPATLPSVAVTRKRPQAGPLERLRAICMGLPEVAERLSHGAPTWFVRGKSVFVTYLEHGHH